MNLSIKSLTNTLSSFGFTIAALLLYALLLAAATIVEKHFGTPAAKELFYYSPLLILVQALLVANFILSAGKHQYLKKSRLGLVLTHSAFAVILAGALTTHLIGKDGIVHIREGETTNLLLIPDGKNMKTEELPFSIKLNDFILKRYPGSNSPSSYESMVVVYHHDQATEAHIYMNNVLDIEGYRFFQSSYDKDEKGSILSVSYDVAGRNITYTGYLLLAAGLLLSFTGRGGRFRTLYRKLQHTNRTLMLLFMLTGAAYPALAAGSNEAENIVRKFAVSPQHAAHFGQLPVQAANGRMMPVNTYSSEILRKLYKANQVAGLNPDQFLVSLFVMPDVWMRFPLLSLDDEELASKYGLSVPHCSYEEAFNTAGEYKLRQELETIYRKNPAERNRMEKAILKLDEQINIFHLLINRQNLKIFPLPDDSNHTWYAPGDNLSRFKGKDSMFVASIFDWYLEETALAMQNGKWEEADKVLDMVSTYQQAKATGVDISSDKMDAEITYNRLNIFKYSRIGYFIFGGLSLVFAFMSLFEIYRSRWVEYLLVAGVILVFGFHTYGMGMRWYIGGYAPWSNSYETMVYVAWTVILAGLIFVRRSLLIFALGTLFSGVILFVSGLNWMDPQITTLVPVLKSPWLMFHVAVIVAAYGFFGLGCLTGATNLTLMVLAKRSKTPHQIWIRIREFSIMNEMALWIGLALMTVGTFLGAVWANESWGRYWGWDPKETWALITMVVYAVVTHIHVIRTRHQEWLFNFLSVVAVSSVLMTFFGVNYFLSGMHSYGQNDNISNLFIWIGTAFAAVALLGFISYSPDPDRSVGEKL